MRFLQSILAGAALVAAAFAVEINEFPKEVKAGQTYKVTYTPGDNTPTTFILRKGDNANLDTITTLTESATGGTFMWSVDAALPNAKDYALEIRQGGKTNYIGPITLTGGTQATSSASKASSTAASTTSAPSTLTTSTATVSSSVSGNATATSASLSRSGTPKPSTTPTETLRAPEPTGAASAFGSSPMALLFGAVAAMAYLN